MSSSPGEMASICSYSINRGVVGVTRVAIRYKARENADLRQALHWR